MPAHSPIVSTSMNRLKGQWLRKFADVVGFFQRRSFNWMLRRICQMKRFYLSKRIGEIFLTRSQKQDFPKKSHKLKNDSWGLPTVIMASEAKLQEVCGAIALDGR